MYVKPNIGRTKVEDVHDVIDQEFQLCQPFDNIWNSPLVT